MYARCVRITKLRIQLWSLQRTQFYLEGVKEHLIVEFDQLRGFIHVVGETNKHDVVDAKQRDQHEGGLGQFSAWQNSTI